MILVNYFGYLCTTTSYLTLQFYLFPAPPLSVDNVMAVLETMPWREVGDMLFVPDSKLDAMDADHTTDEGGKGAVIRYWLLRDPHASWRRCIERLDSWNEINIADQIQNYAEKQKGQ